MRHLPAILLTLSIGCAAKVPFPVAGRDTLVWRTDLQDGAEHWRAQAVERFGPNVFVFACHGVEGATEWECVTEDGRRERVEAVARVLSDLMPDRTIVLLCCNPNAREISVPRGNVYYARRNLTIEPGAMLPTCDNSIWAMRP